MKKNVQGIIAEFKNPAELISAAEQLRESEYRKFDCHSPFPIHGMDDAMGEKRSPLGWIVGIVAFCGISAGILLEWWTSTIDYPIVISGKPFFSYQAYGPVAFAVMVLTSAIATVVAMLALNKLPRFHHPVFSSDKFARASDDAFYVSIESDDPNFDEEGVAKFLEKIGGQNIELLLEETS